MPAFGASNIVHLSPFESSSVSIRHPLRLSYVFGVSSARCLEASVSCGGLRLLPFASTMLSHGEYGMRMRIRPFFFTSMVNSPCSARSTTEFGSASGVGSVTWNSCQFVSPQTCLRYGIPRWTRARSRSPPSPSSLSFGSTT